MGLAGSRLNLVCQSGLPPVPSLQRPFALERSLCIPLSFFYARSSLCDDYACRIRQRIFSFIVFIGGSRSTRYGVDFSRNITSNFEIHGEFAYIEDFQKRYIDSNGNILSLTYDTVSYLLGIRYLSQGN